MTLWKISAKSNWNWGTGKQLVKGMFIELSTPTGTSLPIQKRMPLFYRQITFLGGIRT